MHEIKHVDLDLQLNSDQKVTNSKKLDDAIPTLAPMRNLKYPKWPLAYGNMKNLP